MAGRSTWWWRSAAGGLADRRGALLAAGATAVAALVTTAVAVTATWALTATTKDAPQAPPGGEHSAVSATSAAQPARLRIPTIEVDSVLVDVVREPDGTLEVPSDYEVAGWYAGGPSPGEVGGPPAVIAGHVDSSTGPAVFYRLHELKKGSTIAVTGIDGVVHTFAVYRMADYSKTAFPAAEVYAPTDRAELRLITCSGDFDRNQRSYTDNLVVYATLDGGAR
ncbi:class F sortase [Asanoa iriomotensis]|uniref:Sortase family protein n=1 Tax=Asanoa iriomotensis TaxID=234613 RepID=A0ABQ4CGE6_9ACTN|nr:class F sortase [Asanoa iriomotensis]GIF61847.1 hypothetical protein Air01nite_79420 [Asanoa iriomotensis]